MRAITLLRGSLLVLSIAGASAAACSAVGDRTEGGGGDSSGSLSGGGGDGSLCGTCLGSTYTRCDDGKVTTEECPLSCSPGKGCTACSASGTICVGNEVHSCSGDGTAGPLVSTCD